MHRTLPSFVLMLTAWASVLWAGPIPSPFDDMDPLIDQSDLIVKAHVIRVESGQRDTTIHLVIDEVFKGAVEKKTILVKHHGGKHLIEPSEPSFTSYETALLYLKQFGDIYRCVDFAHGKKTIRNHNIYLHPTNSFVSMKLDKYIAELRSKLSSGMS